MAPKSSAGKEHKGHSAKQGGGQKSERGARSDKLGGPGKMPKGRGMSAGKGIDNLAAGHDNVFEGRGKLGGGLSKKNGCLPKLFMLLLPFMALGAYFFLKF